MAEDDEWSRLQQFIWPIWGRAPFGMNEELTRDMDLYHDLDWNPKKIAIVMNEWANKFGVDMTEFDLYHYYPSAALSRWEFFITTLKAPFNVTARETLGGWQLTLGMMEDAMKTGHWKK